jgi:hypothetical protein
LPLPTCRERQRGEPRFSSKAARCRVWLPLCGMRWP